jgi:O-antigen biosynthesis protein
MAEAARAVTDVVIPVYAHVEWTRQCIESVLAHSGAALGRLLLVNDCGPEPEMLPMLRAFRRQDRRVVLLENEQNRGFVSSSNRGLSLCRGDVVLLNSDTRVTPRWLAGLQEAAAANPRLAALSPLSNNGFACSVPVFQQASPASLFEPYRLDLSGLPPYTVMPTAVGFCLWLRGEALKRLGLLDPKYGRGYQEENDWCQRARAAGYLVGRANRVFVFHEGEASFAGARKVLDVVNLRRLVRRYPRYLEENAAFEQQWEARQAAEYVARQLEQQRSAPAAPRPTFVHAG